MERALYQPGLGYYRRDRSPVGREGDFYTSVSATPLFGRILAGVFVRLRREMGDPDGFAVVEFGGHRGQLRDDVRAAAPDLPWRIVEAGDAWPEPFSGVVFANEFLDALPVHRVRVAGGSWVERYVVESPAAPGGFAWTDGPLSDARLAGRLAGLPADRMEGYETEVCLAAGDWMERVGGLLGRGFVLTIDYGFERHEYFAPHRHQGTLRGYRNHRMTSDLLAHPGEQDLTAHVEFSSLMEAGRQAGLETVEFTDQGRFLIREAAAVPGLLDTESDRRAFQQLTHPALMGAAFRVLVQRRRGSFRLQPPGDTVRRR
jgi:SAM-dependent MidA family methyltransferase